MELRLLRLQKAAIHKFRGLTGILLGTTATGYVSQLEEDGSWSRYGSSRRSVLSSIILTWFLKRTATSSALGLSELDY